MNIIKKLLFCSSAMCVGWVASTTKVSAAATNTADIKGFKINSSMKYCEGTESTSSISLAGSKWTYGSVTLYTSTYKVKMDNYTYAYAICVEAKNSSNTENLKDGYYRMVNKEMIIESTVKGIDTETYSLAKYTPQDYNAPEIKNTTSTSFGVTITTSGIEMTPAISFDYSVEKSMINLKATSKNDSATLNFTLNKTKDKKYNNKHPLRGDCIERMVFVYEVDSSSANSKDLEFDIKFQGKIQKMACTIFGCSGCETETGIITAKIKPNANKDKWGKVTGTVNFQCATA